MRQAEGGAGVVDEERGIVDAHMVGGPEDLFDEAKKGLAVEVGAEVKKSWTGL